MTDYINDFLSLPLWFTIPLTVSYFGLMGYIIYSLWHFRKC